MARGRRRKAPLERDAVAESRPETEFQQVFKLVGPEQEDVDCDISVAALPLEQAEKLRLARRPDISKLKDGVEKLPDGYVRVLFKPGEDIIVERRTALFPGSPWLDTRRLKVVCVDEFTGTIRCEDEEKCRAATFVRLSSPLQKIKLAPKKRKAGDL